MVRRTALAVGAVAALLGGCQLPNSPDILEGEGTVSITTVGPGGATHIIVACPPETQPVVVSPKPARGR